jgi:DNA-binding IclR family transcriptional regulator
VVATGLPRATAHRLATALERHGLVRRDGDGRFILGTRLLALGRAAAETWPLATAAAVPLETLRDETGESVQLFVRDGDERVCIAALQSLHCIRTIVPLGARLPLSAGSAARALLSSAQEKDAWVESVGEREAGVASVSAPVRESSGLVVAAVSVSGPIERTTRQPGKRYGSFVVKAAREIESIAGFRGVVL